MGDDGHSALHWAALKGNLRAMLSLLRAGARVDAQDNWHFTPLTRAAQNGHLLAVLLLLQVLPPGSMLVDGCWLPSRAWQCSSLQALMRGPTMAQEGADPLLKDEEGHNCLHWAVFHRHHQVVQWLLQQATMRAHVDEMDTIGQTALHLGARKSGREMCRRLLEAGASPSAVDAKGLTPEAAATKEGRRSNAGYLRWHARLPLWLGRMTVARGVGGRAYVTCPTPHGAIAAACIALAYLYYAVVLLPGTWSQHSTAHWLLAVTTLPMVACFLMAWKGDPGLIPAQPAAVIAGLASGELGMEDLIMPAVSPKYPRAKFSRMFNCYVARRERRVTPFRSIPAIKCKISSCHFFPRFQCP